MDLRALLEQEIAEELIDGDDPEEELFSNADSASCHPDQDRSTDANDEWEQFVSSCAALQSAWEELPPPVVTSHDPPSFKEAIFSHKENLLLKIPFFTPTTTSRASEEDRREVASSLQSVIDAIVYQFEVFNKESILLQTTAHSHDNEIFFQLQSEIAYSVFDEAKEMELLRQGSILPNEESHGVAYQFYEGSPEVEEQLPADLSVPLEYERFDGEDDTELQRQLQSDRAQRVQRKHKRRLMEQEARRRRLIDSSAVLFSADF